MEFDVTSGSSLSIVELFGELSVDEVSFDVEAVSEVELVSVVLSVVVLSVVVLSVVVLVSVESTSELFSLVSFILEVPLLVSSVLFEDVLSLEEPLSRFSVSLDVEFENTSSSPVSSSVLLVVPPYSSSLFSVEEFVEELESSEELEGMVSPSLSSVVLVLASVEELAPSPA